MMFRHLLAAVAAAGFLCTAATGARAQGPTAIKFAYPAPAKGWLYEKGVMPWVKKVEDSSGGLLEIKTYPGGAIANFRNVYDRLLNGVAEIGFGTFGVIEGQFPRTTVSGLPFLADNSTENSLAVWRLIANGTIGEEYARVKPLTVLSFGSSGLFLTKPIKTLDELHGMKVLANGRSTSRIVSLLGAVPVTSNPAELYQSLSRGLAEGTAITFSAIEQFKLAEITKQHVDIPFGRTGGYFFMNKETFERLPDKAKQAIDAHSGEELTKILGKASDDQNDGDRATVLAQPGYTERPLSPAEVESLQKTLAPLTEEWVAATPDGAKVLAAFKAEVAKIRKGS
jgi:TRAP-type C4-dicarboxylate transport system substrate-binding protein